MSKGNCKLNSMQFDNLAASSWFQVSENKESLHNFLQNCVGKSVHKKQKFEKYFIKLYLCGLPRFLLL